MSREIAELAKGLAGDMQARFASSQGLRKLFTAGTDLSPAVPFLLDHLPELDPKVQLIALSTLIKFGPRADVESRVHQVIAQLNHKDRDSRRQATDILLAWTSYTGHDRELEPVTPQAVYLALAEAYSHEDPVVRERVHSCFYSDAWHAPDFAAVLKVLLRAYQGTDEEVLRVIEGTIEFAVVRGRDVTAAVPKLKKRLGEDGHALTALLVHSVQKDDRRTAMKLMRRPDCDLYCCQEVARTRPMTPTLIECLSQFLTYAEVPIRDKAASGLYHIAREGGDISPAVEALGRALSDSAKCRTSFQTVGELAAWALAYGAMGSSLQAVLAILDDDKFSKSKQKTVSKNVGIALDIMTGKSLISPPI